MPALPLIGADTRAMVANEYYCCLSRRRTAHYDFISNIRSNHGSGSAGNLASSMKFARRLFVGIPEIPPVGSAIPTTSTRSVLFPGSMGYRRALRITGSTARRLRWTDESHSMINARQFLPDRWLCVICASELKICSLQALIYPLVSDSRFQHNMTGHDLTST